MNILKEDQEVDRQCVGILGAGAIGAYLVMGLSEKYGDRLWVIADGERKKRLETEGLCINDKNYPLCVKTPYEAAGVDVLFVCVKYNALPAALKDIETIVGEHTVVVSLLNGIDSEEIIGARIGTERLVRALIRIASYREGNTIHFPLPSAPMGIFVGVDVPDSKSDPRVQQVSEVLSGSGLIYHLSDNILRDVWEKFSLNIARNLPQAILGVGVGAYDDSSYVKDLSEKLRDEVAAVARAKGIEIRGELPRSDAKPAQHYSTLQDLDAGRDTEIEMFSGALIRMGREVGVACPYNEVVYDLIKALEEKNKGKFDYV